MGNTILLTIFLQNPITCAGAIGRRAKMKEIRCPVCGRKLLEIDGQATISIKCPKCKNIVLITTKDTKSNTRLPN